MRPITKVTDEIRVELAGANVWRVSPARAAALVGELRAHGPVDVAAARSVELQSLDLGAIAVVSACDAALATLS